MPNFEIRTATNKITPQDTPRELVKTPNEIDGEIDGALKDSDDINEPKIEDSELDRWETENGKYGAELFGIKEIMKEFPLSAYFGIFDNYVREEIIERGWSKSHDNYQKIVDEIESEIGTSRLETYSRMKRLSEYAKVMNRIRELKKKKDSFLIK